MIQVLDIFNTKHIFKTKRFFGPSFLLFFMVGPLHVGAVRIPHASQKKSSTMVSVLGLNAPGALLAGSALLAVGTAVWWKGVNKGSAGNEGEGIVYKKNPELFNAVQEGNFEKVKRLIEKKPDDVNAKGDVIADEQPGERWKFCNQTPLTYLLDQTPDFFADINNIKIAKELINAPEFDLDKQTNGVLLGEGEGAIVLAQKLKKEVERIIGPMERLLQAGGSPDLDLPTMQWPQGTYTGDEKREEVRKRLKVLNNNLEEIDEIIHLLELKRQQEDETESSSDDILRVDVKQVEQEVKSDYEDTSSSEYKEMEVENDNQGQDHSPSTEEWHEV